LESARRKEDAEKAVLAAERARLQVLAEEEARQKAVEEEEARLRAEVEEQRRKLIEDEEARLKHVMEAQAEERHAMESAQRRQAQDQAAILAAHERQQIFAEDSRQRALEEEEARLKAAVEAKTQQMNEEEAARAKAAWDAELEERRALESARRKEDAEKAVLAAERARLQVLAEEEARQKNVEEEEEARLRVEAEERLNNLRAAEIERQRIAAEVEARRALESARVRHQSEEASRLLAAREEDARRQMEEREQEIAKALAEEQARLKAIAEEEAQLRKEHERKEREAAALESLRRKEKAIQERQRLVDEEQERLKALQEEQIARQAEKEQAIQRAAEMEAMRKVFDQEAKVKAREVQQAMRDVAGVLSGRSSDFVDRALHSCAKSARILGGDSIPSSGSSSGQSGSSSFEVTMSHPLDSQRFSSVALPHPGQILRPMPVIPPLWEPHPRSDGFAHAWRQALSDGASDVSSLPPSEPVTAHSCVEHSYQHGEISQQCATGIVAEVPTFVPQPWIPGTSSSSTSSSTSSSSSTPHARLEVGLSVENKDSSPRPCSFIAPPEAVTVKPEPCRSEVLFPEQDDEQGLLPVFVPPSSSRQSDADLCTGEEHVGGHANEPQPWSSRSSISADAPHASAAVHSLVDPKLVSELAQLLCASSTPPSSGRDSPRGSQWTSVGTPNMISARSHKNDAHLAQHLVEYTRAEDIAHREGNPIDSAYIHDAAAAAARYRDAQEIEMPGMPSPQSGMADSMGSWRLPSSRSSHSCMIKDSVCSSPAEQFTGDRKRIVVGQPAEMQETSSEVAASQGLGCMLDQFERSARSDTSGGTRKRTQSEASARSMAKRSEALDRSARLSHSHVSARSLAESSQASARSGVSVFSADAKLANTACSLEPAGFADSKELEQASLVGRSEASARSAVFACSLASHRSAPSSSPASARSAVARPTDGYSEISARSPVSFRSDASIRSLAHSGISGGWVLPSTHTSHAAYPTMQTTQEATSAALFSQCVGTPPTHRSTSKERIAQLNIPSLPLRDLEADDGLWSHALQGLSQALLTGADALSSSSRSGSSMSSAFSQRWQHKQAEPPQPLPVSNSAVGALTLQPEPSLDYRTGPQCEVIELLFDAPFAEVDLDRFHAGVVSGLVAQGFTDEDLAQMTISLHPGSVIVRIAAPPNLAKRLQQAPLGNLVVEGCPAHLSRQQLEEARLCRKPTPRDDLTPATLHESEGASLPRPQTTIESDVRRRLLEPSESLKRQLLTALGGNMSRPTHEDINEMASRIAHMRLLTAEQRTQVQEMLHDIADALFGAAAMSSSHAAASAGAAASAAAAAAATASRKYNDSAHVAAPNFTRPVPTETVQQVLAATAAVSITPQAAGLPPVSPLAALAGPGTARRPTSDDLEYMARAVGQRNGMAQVPAARAMMQLMSEVFFGRERLATGGESPWQQMSSIPKPSPEACEEVIRRVVARTGGRGRERTIRQMLFCLTESLFGPEITEETDYTSAMHTARSSVCSQSSSVRQTAREVEEAAVIQQVGSRAEMVNLFTELCGVLLPEEDRGGC